MKITNDYRKLALAFEKDAEATRDMVKANIERACIMVKEEAKDTHKFVDRGGETHKSIVYKTEGDTKGTVYLASKVAVYMHEGTRPHIIRPRIKKALRWMVGKDNEAFAKVVHHPGTKADPFLDNALDTCEPAIVKRFAEDLEKAVK